MSLQDEHQEHGSAVESGSSPENDAGTRRALRADLLRLGRVAGAKSAASTAAVLEGHDALDGYTAVWVPLAERRREAATGSPADQARWSRLIEGAARPSARSVASYESLVLRAGHARDLLRALADTTPPWVPIADVARRIKKQIEAGSYLSGAVLAPGRLAADLALPLPSVHLALSDLAAEGVVEPKGNNRVGVPGPHLEQDRPGQLAELIKKFMQQGVFPPGVALPERRELCRILVTGQGPLSVAVQSLFDEGVLELGAFRRPTVCRDAAKRPKTPAELPGPAPDLTLRASQIREVVHRTRGWWNARLSPVPSALDEAIAQLGAAAHQLVGRARCGPIPPTTTHQQVSALIARTAVIAAAMHRPHSQLRVWHAACLATAVGDLQALVDSNRLAGTPATPLSA
ncbi:hypothetical protein AB0C96_12075 [Streptomyces sp. NPDC048506]|uniref:hypothetical protein n=1 Tax=Streptomyces sp. NPDC048506 TaxID=3155028 RepID=UPI0034181C6E